MRVEIDDTLPDADLYCEFRREAGWDIPEKNRAAMAMKKSLFGITATLDGHIVGMARVIGDGAMNIYLQDVIVRKLYRGHGVGKALVRAAVSRMKADYPPNITVGLLASEGNEPLYARFGFVARPSGPLGAGMMAALSDLRADV